jgi:hypothetical protein
VSEFLHSSFVAAWIFQSGFSWEVWLPYLFGAIILAIGLFGPPAIWNRPWDSPPRSDLFGTYQETDRNLERREPASITLLADGSMMSKL